MPPKYSKIEALNDGIQLGQMEVILTVLIEKVLSEEELCEKAKALLPKLEMLKLTFRAKCLRRTANFEPEQKNMRALDEELNQLLDEMKAANITFFD